MRSVTGKETPSVPDAGGEDVQVAEVLAGLGRVGAPADFGMRVKARIVAGRESRASRFRLVPALAAAAAVLVAGGIYFQSHRGDSGTGVAVDQGVESAISPDIAGQAVPPVQPSSETAKDQPLREPRQPGRSEEFTVREEGVTAAPVIGVGTRAASEGEAPVRPRAPQTVVATEYLLRLGAVVSSEGGQLVVGSVTPGSPAQRNGLRVGDMVVAVDGIALTGATVLQADFTGRMMQVRRPSEPKPVLIELK